jgi:hypothetical protein
MSEVENKPTSTETKRIDGSITYKKQRNGRYVRCGWLEYGDGLVPFMEPFIVIPDKPLLEELISLDVRRVKYLLIGQFQSWLLQWRKFLTIAHQHAIAVHVHYGCHGFGYTNSVSIAFACTHVYGIYAQVSIWRRFVISPRVPCSHHLIDVYHSHWLPVVLVWICGSCYTFLPTILCCWNTRLESLKPYAWCYVVWCTLVDECKHHHVIIKTTRVRASVPQWCASSSLYSVVRFSTGLELLRRNGRDCSFLPSRRWFPWSSMSLVRSLSLTPYL